MSEEINSEIIDFKKPYKLFPFLSSFPFQEYTISVEKSSKDDIEVDPMIAKEASTISNLDFINFTCKHGDSDICFSFYTFDIEYICSISRKVRKLDSIREKLDIGISSNELDCKLKTIREGEKFIKKLGHSLLAGKSFDVILDEMLKLREASVKQSVLDKIKLFKDVDYSSIDYLAIDCILDYYDLHLHHIKILLGIVIATKIY